MFEFANYWILCLLPLPLLVIWLFPRKNSIKQHALIVPFFDKIKTNNNTQVSFKRMSYRFWVMLFIWALLVLAAAGPQWLGKPVFSPRSGRDIMLAVDLSMSMHTDDMMLNHHRVDRLTVVKQAAREFIQHRVGDRLGLILFGTRAYLQTPLTFDRKTVMQMLDDATIGLAGSETAIGDAIGLAVKRLMKAKGKSKVLILLTDGRNNSGVVSPIAAANIAAKEGIKIYTIGLGATQITVNTFLGPRTVNAPNALDEAMLQKVAKVTGGMFFRAQNSTELQNVYQALNRLEPVASNPASFRPKTPLYPWPLALAFLLSLLIVFRRLHLNLFADKRELSS